MAAPCDSEYIFDALYDGIIDPDALETALELCMARLDASGANIHVVSKRSLDTLFFTGLGEGYTDQSIAAYLDHWQYVNAHRDAMRRAYRCKPEAVFLCHEHISADDWRRGGYFQNFYAKLGQRWLAGGIAWSGKETEVSITFSRSANTDPFDEQARAFLATLLPHVRRASRLALKLGDPQSAGPGTVNGALGAARTPAFLVNADARIQWKNAAGEELLKSRDAISERNGRLVTTNGRKHRALQKLIASAVDKRLAETPPGFLRTKDRQGPVEIEVLPATTPDGALIEAHALALVMVRAVGLSPTVYITLKTEHDLTDAESRLAVALAKGISLEEAATSGSISQHTVRAQLRSIFAKTGVNRQSALAALVWQSA